MKILAGIPSRLRNTSGKIADVLAEVADHVIVISQGAVVTAQSEDVEIIEKDVNFGLVNARNAILDYAVENGYDYVIQSDDDLSYTAKVVEALVETAYNNPTLGGIASSSRAYFHWDEANACTRDFLVAPCTPQLWCARTSILQEIGPWKLEYLEDREHGARAWKLGYALATLHVSLDLTHNAFIARTSASTETGGQAKGADRRAHLSTAIDYMMKYHSDIVTMRIADPGMNRTFFSRYNWSRMIQLAQERFGTVLGYKDSKGKIL